MAQGNDYPPNGAGNNEIGAESYESEQDLESQIDEALLHLDELALEDPEEALAMFDSLPEPVQALRDFQLLLARAHHSLRDVETARDILLALHLTTQDSAELHHQLGDVLEDLGEIEAANQHFVRVRTLDEKDFLEISPEERARFHRQVEAALQKISTSLSSKNCQTLAVPLPSEADIHAGLDPRRLARWDPESHVLTGYVANLVAEFSDLKESDAWDEEVYAAILRDISDDIE